MNNRFFCVDFTPQPCRSLSTVLFLLTLSLPFFAGCDFRRVVVNNPIDLQSLETLSPGKSSVQDVVQAFGAPDEIAARPDGMVFRYRYANSKTMRVNFGYIFRIFLPWAPSMHMGRGQEVPEVLHIAMNQDGIFDRYLLQQPPEPPQFSFWPF